MIATRRRRKYGGRLSSSNEAGAQWPRSSTQIRRARRAWLNAQQAVGDDPTKQPHRESPISVDINAFSVGVKKLQTATCDGVKLLWAKVMDMRAVALPKDDQRRVTYLSRRKDIFRPETSPRVP